VFAKDPQREYKDKVKDLDIPQIARIIGYSKIEKKFPTYKDKLKLFYSYD
jgi:ribosome biogenesis protein UTP30